MAMRNYFGAALCNYEAPRVVPIQNNTYKNDICNFLLSLLVTLHNPFKHHLGFITVEEGTNLVSIKVNSSSKSSLQKRRKLQ